MMKCNWKECRAVGSQAWRRFRGQVLRTSTAWKNRKRTKHLLSFGFQEDFVTVGRRELEVRCAHILTLLRPLTLATSGSFLVGYLGSGIKNKMMPCANRDILTSFLFCPFYFFLMVYGSKILEPY